MNNKDCKSLSCTIKGASTTTTANPTLTLDRPQEAPTGAAKQSGQFGTHHGRQQAISNLQTRSARPPWRPPWTADPFDQSSAWMSSSARAPSHPPARRPPHFFPTGKSVKKPLPRLFTRNCERSCQSRIREKKILRTSTTRNVNDLRKETRQSALPPTVPPSADDAGSQIAAEFCLERSWALR